MPTEKKDLSINVSQANNGFIVNTNWLEVVAGPQWEGDERQSHDEYKSEVFVFTDAGEIGDFIAETLGA